MRLIDADDVVTVFTNRMFEILKTQIPTITATESHICLETCYKVAKYEIDNIPTAYDIDKVVEGLKTDDSVKLMGSLNSNNYMIPLSKAIEIVKVGGKNE